MPALELHRLITPALLQRFHLEAEAEAGDGRYYACMLRPDGDVLVHHPIGPQLAPEQMMWAADVLRALNRELHHDGAWVVVFTHPKPAPTNSVIKSGSNHCEYARYCLIWVDQDGDAQFTQEWMENEGDLLDFADVLLAGIESTMAKCEGSWEMWHHHMRQVIAPKQDQLFKRAQGQRAPSAN